MAWHAILVSVVVIDEFEKSKGNVATDRVVIKCLSLIVPHVVAHFGERNVPRLAWNVGVKAIELDHAFHLFRNGLVGDEEFGKGIYVGWLDSDVDADHERKFESHLLLFVVDQIQVKCSTDLEHIDQCGIAHYGFDESFLMPLGRSAGVHQVL